MNALLFAEAEVARKSPRLKWMERHNVSTQEFMDARPGDEDEFVGEMFRWHAWAGGGTCDPRKTRGHGVGWTEQEALVDLAHKCGWRLWNEEGRWSL